jgi:hypothetical protein
MKKFQSESPNLSTPLSGNYIFANAEVWLPQPHRLQDAGNTAAGSVVVTSGSIFISSGNGTWHQFALGVNEAPIIQPNNALVSGNLTSWVYGDPSTVGVSGVSGVSYWLDSGPQGNHWTMDATATVPFVSSGIQNGREAIYFPGSGPFLTSSGDWVGPEFSGDDEPATVFFVVRHDINDLANHQSAVCFGNTASGGQFHMFGMNAGAGNEYRSERGQDVAGSIWYAPSGNTQGDWQVVAHYFPGTLMETWKNRVKANVAQSGMNLGVNTFNTASIGATQKNTVGDYFKGMIGEVAIYNTGLSEANILGIMRAMQDRWGIIT